MSKDTVRETVGILGVVASLVFVGLEVRQSTALARGQARQALAEVNDLWLSNLTSDLVYSDLWYRAWETEGQVGEEEVFRASYMMTQFMRRLENVHFQFQEGLVDATALRSYGLQNFEGLFVVRGFKNGGSNRGGEKAFTPTS